MESIREIERQGDDWMSEERERMIKEQLEGADTPWQATYPTDWQRHRSSRDDQSLSAAAPCPPLNIMRIRERHARIWLPQLTMKYCLLIYMYTEGRWVISQFLRFTQYKDRYCCSHGFLFQVNPSLMTCILVYTSCDLSVIALEWGKLSSRKLQEGWVIPLKCL